MISLLKIKNFAIIENIELNFTKGLNVLTGETGAGKTILINAIKLILGNRASADLVRHGTNEAELQAVFNITNYPEVLAELQVAGIETDSELIIRRIITSKGQSKIFINDNSVTLALLLKITPSLMDICSQFENRTLFLPENQIKLLDNYCKNYEKVNTFKEYYNNITDIKRKLKELAQLDEEKEKKLDYYKFQLGEIQAVSPKKDEDLDLEKEMQELNQNKLFSELAENAKYTFFESDNSVITKLEELLEKVSKIFDMSKDPQMADRKDRISEALGILNNLGKDFLSFKKTVNYSPQRREQIVIRLEKLSKLKRKYGEGSLKVVFDKIEVLKSEILKMENTDEIKRKLQHELKQISSKAEVLGKELHEIRVKSAKNISKKITEQLQDLNMKGAILQIIVDFNQEKLTALGYDDVSFSFAPNKGEPFNLLSKIASGGELSRVTLAIHNVLTKENSEKIYIFDEVDTGIGGDTGRLVGRKLKEISREHQVICITHLPQVAVFGDSHILLSKEENNERVTTKSSQLDTTIKRIEEIARMLTGNSKKKEALDHAEVLLKDALKD
jgi:DNA repair protein RecN (Recombination protein N)